MVVVVAVVVAVVVETSVTVSWMLTVWTMVTVAGVLVLTIAVTAGGAAASGVSVTKNAADDAAGASVAVVPPATTVPGWGWYGSVVVVTGTTATVAPEEAWGFGLAVVVGTAGVAWDVVGLVVDLVIDLVVDVTNVVGTAAAGVLDVDRVTKTVCVCGTVWVTVVSAEPVGEFVVEGDEEDDEAADEATTMPRVASAICTLTQPTSTPYSFGSGIAKQLVPEDGVQVASNAKVLELASHFMTLPPMHAIWLAVQRESRVRLA